MKQQFIVAILLFACFQWALPAMGQQVAWRADRPLTWADFKGPKPRKTRFAAATNSHLHYKVNKYSDDSIGVVVDCSFNCKKSWKKNNRLKPELLKHEQVHFDIAEIYARQMRRSFDRYIARHTNYTYATESLRMIAYRKFQKYRRCQRQYDRLTKHSRNKPVQEEWNRKIAGELSELNAYEVR